MKATAICVVILLTAFMAPICAQQLGERVSGDGYDGIILLPSPHSSNYWAPAKADITKVENQVLKDPRPEPKSSAAYIPAEQLRKYKRYYKGVRFKDRSYIYVEFLHESNRIVKDGSWSQKYPGPVTYDYAMAYDMTQGKFVELVDWTLD